MRPHPVLDVTAAPQNIPHATESFGYSERSSRPESTQLPGSLSSPSTPGHWSSHGHELEPRRIRIKRIRTACEECRKRKQRCDGNEPCAACEEQGTMCRYRDVPPAKKDPTIDKILEMSKEHNKSLESLTQGINSLQTSLRGIEARLARRK
ncbi:unnamed protein product [Zymoseptoria tritici ST99CH_1A5]|nr:unnamed protein product [Zymoseptoria tritici ST99CH_3D7]SMR52298.1 unnamed protein product [Zymoseptoria tritici ST99CH_1E4]SMR53395.1 unnamed protein product [Zymoseptoria tritici ST99CH_3D1]SMY24213.1 unnamed protein product [Zymoseptoria tritici ST99CH_1A5]